MASLVGHVLGATAVWELGRRPPNPAVPRSVGWYLLPAAVALAPDLDSIAPMVFRSLGQMAHRGPSHSLLGAVVLAGCAGVVVWLFGGRERRPCRALVVLLGCALAHPALDYLMAGGPPVPFLWPFVHRGWLSPVQLIPTAYYARTASGLLGILWRPHTWAGIALEFTSLGAAVAGCRPQTARRNSGLPAGIRWRVPAHLGCVPLRRLRYDGAGRAP